MGPKKQNCRFCTYSWISRVATPKSCPRCKRRFDYEAAMRILNEIEREFGYDLVGGEQWQTKR